MGNNDENRKKCCAWFNASHAAKRNKCIYCKYSKDENEEAVFRDNVFGLFADRNDAKWNIVFAPEGIADEILEKEFIEDEESNACISYCSNIDFFKKYRKESAEKAKTIIRSIYKK